jgi:hypothetical protein
LLAYFTRAAESSRFHGRIMPNDVGMRI